MILGWSNDRLMDQASLGLLVFAEDSRTFVSRWLGSPDIYLANIYTDYIYPIYIFARYITSVCKYLIWTLNKLKMCYMKCFSRQLNILKLCSYFFLILLWCTSKMFLFVKISNKYFCGVLPRFRHLRAVGKGFWTKKSSAH